MRQHKFRVLLEKDENSAATGFWMPFNIEDVFGMRGRVPVRGTINGFPFRSTLAPMSGRHIMPVNRELREGAKAVAGDFIEVFLEIDNEPRTVTPPDDLLAALKKNQAAAAAWNKLAYTHQKEYARAVEDAKKPETRARRIENTLAALLVKPKTAGGKN